MGTARDPGSILNLEDGVRAHQVIAAHAARVRALQRARTLVMVVILVLLAAGLVQLLFGSGLLQP